MLIRKNEENGVITAELSGRLDSASAPGCEEELLSFTDATDSLILDLKDLEYVSSAGLRVFLLLQKQMTKKDGKLVLRNVNEAVREVLDITGFTDILSIEG